MGSNLSEIVLAFGKLGLISFGGPVAHLGYFRSEFVEKRKWISDADYADLVALCQFLPGPASSQTVFALGMWRGGLLGAMGASICFTLPSALLMIAFAYGVASMHDLAHAGWLHGLKVAAAAIVAQAVWGMGRSLCPDRTRRSICIAAAALLLIVPGAIVQIGVIAAGAFIGWWVYHQDPIAAAVSSNEGTQRSHVWATVALIVFAALLVILPTIASTTHSRTWAIFDSFYRSGSLVFGGGHVILPLLRAEVVPRGWISDDQFLAGYGAAQAVPGPLFTFSAYLGAAIASGRWAWINGFWCLLGVFLPCWLLIGGALPFWNRLRGKCRAQASLRGANAAVVGILLAALYTPISTDAIKSGRDVATALLAYGFLVFWKSPSWAVVIALALVGQWLL